MIALSAIQDQKKYRFSSLRLASVSLFLLLRHCRAHHLGLQVWVKEQISVWVDGKNVAIGSKLRKIQTKQQKNMIISISFANVKQISKKWSM